MRMIVYYGGLQYTSVNNKDVTAEQAAEHVYKSMEKMAKLTMELAGGGYLILGRDAAQSCAITVVDDEE